jgi:uncharacterized protein DUF5995
MAPTQPLADVIARMHAELAPLARSDGVACFTRLYLAVTEGVQTDLAGITFQDEAFLARLDETFAGLFLDAFAKQPPAWVPLFASRRARGIAPLQFALAGMSAHINRDLPLALATTCRDLGIAPVEGSPQHADYLRVNTVLARVEARVKQEYLTGWLRRIDRLVHRVHRLDDVVAMWDVSRARDAAWANGCALRALHDAPDVAGSYLAALDRLVGVTARGFLVPAETWLQRLARLTRHVATNED